MATTTPGYVGADLLWGLTEAEAAFVRSWIMRLSTELSSRQSDYDKFSNYYDGEHRLIYSSEKWKAAFGGIFQDFSDNWCQLVVDAVEERLDVVGFRMGPDEKQADDSAWRIWQSNDMDAASQVAHTEALIYGIDYVMVWPDQKTSEPRITIESPGQVIVAISPVDRKTRQAAFKYWVDDSGYLFATLYLPDYIFKFRSREKADVVSANIEPQGWIKRIVPDEEWPLQNKLGVVPIIPLVNKPRLNLRGITPVKGPSEIKSVIPVQDAINKVLLDMLVASEFGSFRQRWVTGMEIPIDPHTKKPVEPWKSAVDRLWTTSNPNVKLGEFSQTDLGGYVQAVETLIQHVASQTRTPPHYFYLSGGFPSGESIKSAESGLVSKSRRKMRHFSDSWEEVIRLAFVITGDNRDLSLAETIWRDPEFHSESEHIDALTKKSSIGVPNEQLWEDAGYSPQQIQRFKQMAMQQQILQNMLAPKPVVQPGQPGQQPPLEQPPNANR